MNQEYIVVSDATVDLDKEILDRLNVRIIPMIYILDGKECYYNPAEETIDYKEFYEKVNAGVPISTSQNPPTVFTDYYKELIAEGYKNILYLCFSSGLSGNYNSAYVGAQEMMEKHPDVTIKVVDSLCASVGEGYYLQEVCAKRDAGAGFEELAEYAEKIKRKVCHWFVVGNLEQLKRGGRINAVEAKLGAILNVHPILTTDAEGKLKVSEKVRGMKKALKELVGKFTKYAEAGISHRVIVAHASCQELAEELKGLALETGKIKECIIQQIGPVIGAHTGSPMCAIVFMGEQEE